MIPSAKPINSCIQRLKVIILLVSERLAPLSYPFPPTRYERRGSDRDLERPTKTYTSQKSRNHSEPLPRKSTSDTKNRKPLRSRSPKSLRRPSSTRRWCIFTAARSSGRISGANRLDATTNWAVITAGATLSFVFSSPDNPHFAIPINSILVSIFLFMEARRYRYYEVWANRVRVLETGYFAPMLSHRTIPPDKEWAEHISADLLAPHFTISEWEAVGRRLRANYLWIFILLALSLDAEDLHSSVRRSRRHPKRPTTVLGRAFRSGRQVGLAPGWLVMLVGAIFNFADIFRRIQHAQAEGCVERGAAAREFRMASAQAGFRMGREQSETPQHDPPLEKSPPANAFDSQDRSLKHLP